MKTKKISFMLAFILFLTFNLNGLLAYSQSSISSKYSGTYTTDNIYIDNINESMKKVNDSISYTTEPEDFDSYRASMSFSNNNSQANMTIEGYSINSSSVSINENNITIVFEKGYYGYTDELDVIYTFKGTINEDVLTGKFTGVIQNTNLVETEGRIEMEAGGFSLDSIIGIFDGNDSNDDNKEDEIIEEKINVTDLLFAEIYKEMKVGQTYEAKATIFPREATNKAVTYETSDPLVARVNKSGTVTAVSKGKADITVRSIDNPNEFDVAQIIVEADYEDYTDEEIEKEEAGMTIFDKETKKEEYEEEFTDIEKEEISENAKDRAEDVYTEIEIIEETNEQIEVEKETNEDKPIIKITDTKKEKEMENKEYENNEDFVKDAKEAVRKIKKPAKDVIGKIIDRIPKPAGIDVFHEYAKEKASEYLDQETGQYKKSEDEIKNQLQKTFSSDNEHFVFKYLKEKAESNKLVKLFAYPINKIFNSKQEHYKEAVYTEYKSVKDKIQKNINAGMEKETAIRSAKNDFVYNDNFDTTFDAIDNAKPGIQRFYAMRQGGKENQVVTGAKKEYHSNDARFDKYIELFEENKEFEEQS